MEVYKLERATDNDKLVLHMAMEQIKKLKEQLTHSLKRRKELVIQMNENLYIEERIEDLCRERILEEADVAIKDLLVRNDTLQEEVRKLKRKQESHSIRLCEVMKQKKKDEEDKIVNDEDKRKTATRIDESINEV